MVVVSNCEQYIRKLTTVNLNCELFYGILFIMNDSTQNLGQRIKQQRNIIGLNIEQLAQKAGVSKAYISQLESGTSTKPSAGKLYDIAVALGTSMADLLGKTVPISNSDAHVEIPLNLSKISKKFDLDDVMLRRLAMIQNRDGDSSDSVSEDKWVSLLMAVKQIDESKDESKS